MITSLGRLVRATSHMSQEPWHYNGENPWLSSKRRTMGVGIAVLGSHQPSSIVWSENSPCCGTIAYFVGRKRGRLWFNRICLKLYKFERTTWWCLSIVECILESSLEYVVNFALLKKVKKRMVSRNLRQAHPLEVGVTKIPGDHETLSIVRHVDFKSMRSSLGV